MRVFISWSGERSKALGEALANWIPDVIQIVKPWMSDHSIRAGARWGTDLHNVLMDTNFGILCLTRENLEKPWLLFEAGSLAKSVDIAHVVPYLLDVSETDVKQPLAQFQGVHANREGTFKLLQSLNEVSGNTVEAARLERLFDNLWPNLEEKIKSVLSIAAESVAPARDEIDYLTEILELVRKVSYRQTAEETIRTDNVIKMALSISKDFETKTPEEIDEVIKRASYSSKHSSTAEQFVEIANIWKELRT